MSESQFEEKLGNLRIGLRSDLEFTRVVNYGRSAYVVHDPLSFSNHMFTLDEYLILSSIVDRRSLKESFECLVSRGIMEEDERDLFYRFILLLHSKNLLVLPIIDADKLYERYRRKLRAKRAAWTTAVMYLRVPIWDPDHFLDKTIRFVRHVFSKLGILVWTLLLGCVVWKLWGRFGQLFSSARILLEFSNIPILYIGLVGLKAMHELGHAYTCKKLGGNVPEIGLAFILATPCAYVDASSSWKFSNKWHRIAVSMGGMYVESMVAFVFALVWAGSSPGLMQDIAVNIVVLASVTTLLFNLSPLMKFDGYYVLADLVNVPNLRERGSKSLARWAKAIFLGLPSPETIRTKKEQVFCASFGVAAFLYKILLAFSMTMMVIMRWPAIGALMGSFFAFLLILAPLFRLGRYLWSHDDTKPVRLRARALGLGCAVGVPLLVSCLPVSLNVVAVGVLEPESPRVVRASTNGFVDEVPVSRGQEVEADEVVVVLEDPGTSLARIEAQEAWIEQRIRLESMRGLKPAEVAKLEPRVAYLEKQAKEADARFAALVLTTDRPGVVATEDPKSLIGSYVRKGDPVLELHSGLKLVRIVLTDYEFQRARMEVGSSVELRWAVDPFVTVPAIVREIRPSASRKGIPVSLTMLAEGDVYALTTPSGEVRGAEPYLHVFVQPESVPLSSSQGLRARVKVPAKTDYLSSWLYRRLLAFYNAWKTS
ncbi:MAG: hypothetical protein ACE5F1_04035 [Planctomycetota bacterium]